MIDQQEEDQNDAFMKDAKSLMQNPAEYRKKIEAELAAEEAAAASKRSFGGGGGDRGDAPGNGVFGGLDATDEHCALRICNGCGTSEMVQGRFKHCINCHNVYYCGATCQKKDWKGRGSHSKYAHRMVCGTEIDSEKRGGLISVVVLPGDPKTRYWYHTHLDTIAGVPSFYHIR